MSVLTLGVAVAVSAITGTYNNKKLKKTILLITLITILINSQFKTGTDTGRV
jgi:hypothetical protein